MTAPPFQKLPSTAGEVRRYVSSRKSNYEYDSSFPEAKLQIHETAFMRLEDAADHCLPIWHV
jgi:hypothetical protein